MKNAFCTPKAINFDFLEAPWPTKDLLWSVQEAYEALQEGFEALQSTSKHSQYVTIVCVGMILFQNAFFNDVSSENTVFAVPRKDQKAFLGRQIWLQEGVKTLQSTVDNDKMSHMCIFVVHCQK